MACPKKLLFADELSEEHPFSDLSIHLLVNVLRDARSRCFFTDVSIFRPLVSVIKNLNHNPSERVMINNI